MPKVLPPPKKLGDKPKPSAIAKPVAALKQRLATKASTACPPAKKSVAQAVPAKTAPKPATKKGAKEEFRIEESRPGEWAWEMFRGGRFVARGEHYSKKGNATRAAEKFNSLLKVPMPIVA